MLRSGGGVPDHAARDPQHQDRWPCVEAFSEACLVAATCIQIDARLDVVGERPLVLWTIGDISIGSAGVLDVASHSAGIAKIGPGSNPLGGCTVDTGTFLASTPQVGGGGSGGGFQSKGGAGGAGRNGVATPSVFASAMIPLAFRGGCDGGVGGLGQLEPGHGGGAVYLMARGDISITGIVDASGSGGRRGVLNDDISGASGGGSGGLIGLEAENVTLTLARLSALGGSGGSGAGQAGSGMDGKDPPNDPPAKALGPAETITSNTGGAGCDLGGSDAVDGGSVGGGIGSGGGGGGGCGWILIYSGKANVTGAKIAPTPDIML